MTEESVAVTHGVVLLSGGLDSSAALVWAQVRYSELRAVTFSYGQPSRYRELAAAKRIALARGVQWTELALSDALMPRAGLLRGVDASATPRFGGVDREFVPGRNLLFATLAAAHASLWFPSGNIDLILGACAEDQSGFPDCRPTTLAMLSAALCMGTGRQIGIRTPWADRTKSEILYAIQPDAEALALVCSSWSCYCGEGPCGTCGACVKRADGFAARGIPDLVEPCHVGSESA
jgi:7-cyano-7-deazaguanine synthase